MPRNAAEEEFGRAEAEEKVAAGRLVKSSGKMADQRYALPRLTSINYHTWKFKMEMLLIKERLWSVISKEKPQVPSEQWVEKDEVARAMIGLWVDDN